MPFKKNDPAINRAGRPRGAKSSKTSQWNSLKEAIQTKHVLKFDSILDNLEGQQFADTYIRVLEYFQPKLSRSEVREIEPEPQLDLSKLSTEEVEALERILGKATPNTSEA